MNDKIVQIAMIHPALVDVFDRASQRGDDTVLQLFDRMLIGDKSAKQELLSRYVWAIPAN